jgi:glycerol-3-phosphate O-acyltransferase
MQLRDLLKFEFFFAEKDAFREEIRAEVALHDPDWETHVTQGPDEIQAVLRRFKPFSAHRVLRPFLEAYRVIADALARREAKTPVEDDEVLSYGLRLGKQYELQRRILSPESVSKALFSNALALARNRGLLRPDTPGLDERRRAFAAEVEDAIRHVDAVAALVAARNAGLIE